MPRDLEHFPSFSFFPENTRLFNAIDSMRRHVTTSRGSQSNEWPSMPIYACIYRMNITIVQRDTKGKVWIGLDWWNTFSEIYCRKFYQHTTLGNKSYFNFRVSYWSLHLWDVMDGKTNIKLQARIKYYKIHFLSTKRCADPHRDYKNLSHHGDWCAKSGEIPFELSVYMFSELQNFLLWQKWCICYCKKVIYEYEKNLLAF